MYPPPVSPRLCDRTSGASIALGGGRDPGDESARPLCSRHFQRTDTTAPVSGCSEVDTQAPGRGWAVSPPPGCWVPKQGPSPRLGRRMAQEAFEAYGKSFPLPALPHLPFPPGYVPPPVSMGTGGSRHGALSTLRRHGDYRQGATAAGDPGVRSLYHGEGREGPKEKTPPPPLQPSASPRACVVLASCLRHACYEGKTTRAPPPPPPTHTAPPPQGWGMKVGGGGKRPPPPPPRTKRQGGEAAERGCGTDHTTVPVGSTRRASPNVGTTGGANSG